MGNKGPHVQTQIFFIFKYASMIDQCEYLKLTSLLNLNQRRDNNYILQARVTMDFSMAAWYCV